MPPKKTPPPHTTLPNLVDDFLAAVRSLTFQAKAVSAWHTQFDVAGGHLADGAITVAEQLRLDTIVQNLNHAIARCTASQNTFIDARENAKRGGTKHDLSVHQPPVL